MSAPEDRILDRVRKLLAQANHPNTGEAERAAFLAKADEMMVRHAIEEAVLAATQSPEQRRKPVTVTTQMYDPHTVWGQKFRTIMGEVCTASRVKCAGGRNGVFTMVGYNDDVDYAQLLFTTIQFQFVAKIQPTWEPLRDFDANVAALKEAGRTEEQIARAAGLRWPEGGSTVKTAYKRHCRANGIDPTYTRRHSAYRESFADSFVTRMCSRLEELGQAAKTQAASSGAELVLYHAQEDVDEEFYRQYPNARPLTKEQVRAMRKAQVEAERLAEEKHQAWLDSLTDKQRVAHERKVQEEAERKARENDRYWRNFDKQQERRYDSTGSRAGRAAADNVDLTRSGPATEAAADRGQLR